MHRDRQRRRPSSRSHGNFANPRDTKRNVVTSGPLSCGDVSRFTLGVGAGTENHDCRVARERGVARTGGKNGEKESACEGKRDRDRGWFVTEERGRSGRNRDREGESERVDNDPADTNSNYPSRRERTRRQKEKDGVCVCVCVTKKKGERCGDSERGIEPTR